MSGRGHVQNVHASFRLSASDSSSRGKYLNGNPGTLLQSAGIRAPAAIVVTYANDKRVLEATRRLRDAYPSAPIFARGRTALDAEALLQVGYG